MDYSSIFGRRANSYIDASESWPDIREQKLANFILLLALKTGERFLDVPCGSGLVAEKLAPNTDYLGLDSSQQFISHCQTKGIPAVQASMHCTELPSAHFDVIDSLTGVHHETHRAGLYKEWFRLLKPGGRVLIAYSALGSPVDHFLNGFVDQWNSEGHQGYFLRDEDPQWIAEAGFATPLISQSSYNWQAPNDITMYRFMLDLFGLDKQPSLTDMQMAWKNLGWQANEQACWVPWTLRVISAYKPEGAAFR